MTSYFCVLLSFATNRIFLLQNASVFPWNIELSSTQEPIQNGQYQWLARLTVPAKRESAGKYRCLTKYETTGETITGDMILQPYCKINDASYVKSNFIDENKF